MTPTDTTLQSCEQAIGYQFRDPELLRQALIHASCCSDRIASNERLEFLGDAILGKIVCDELFCRFPLYLEGELTKVKSMIVSRRTCLQVAGQLKLESYLSVGKGMQESLELPGSCLAAVLEAVIGAIYLDGGDKPTQEFVLRCFKPIFDKADAQLSQENYKSILQQYAQKKMSCTPIYEILDEKGPDHSKCFEISVVIGGQRYSSAWGPNKKDAEQLAAYHTLMEMKLLPANTKAPSA